MKDPIFDEATMTMTASLVPDPRRYIRVENAGEQMWFDRLDMLYFPDEFMRNAAEQLAGLPMYWQQQQIGNAQDYVESRMHEIEASLDGTEASPTFQDKSQEFLNALPDHSLEFAILSVDVVGSTRMASLLDGPTYARIMQTLLFELSLIVPAFHGHVLKYTGDGLIAYFPAPSFIIKNDLALDCALSMRLLVNEGLGPALTRHGLDPVQVRIGIDAGEAEVVTVGSDVTKQERDLLGFTINRATKIRSASQPDEILLGQSADENLHITWRVNLEEISPPIGWPYLNRDGNPYRIFRAGRSPGAGMRIADLAKP